MTKLALILSAAGMTLCTAPALAQTVKAPMGSDVPSVQLNPPPGTSWRSAAPRAVAPAPALRAAPAPKIAARPMEAAKAPPPMVQHHPAPVRIAPAPPMRAHAAPAPMVRQFAHRGPHGRKGYKNYHRIDRGGRVHSFWFGPRYHVRNWGHYGFAAPVQDRRWIRYYDDALLIDGQGRVHDGRWGMDWDRFGESWDYDADAPAYEDGFYGNEEELDYVERDWEGETFADDGHDQERYEDERYGEEAYEEHHERGEVYRDRVIHRAPGHGYQLAYAWPVMVTETTVTVTPAVVEEVTYFEEVAAPKKVYRKKAYGKKRAKARCACKPKATHYGGERG